jgi:hypothetical protein
MKETRSPICLKPASGSDMIVPLFHFVDDTIAHATVGETR